MAAWFDLRAILNASAQAGNPYRGANLGYEVNAKLVRADRVIEETWERALLMFRMRRTVVDHGESVIVLARQRPLLEYYANGIRHLLPAGALPEGQLYSPAQDIGDIAAKYRLQPPPAPRPRTTG